MQEVEETFARSESGTLGAETLSTLQERQREDSSRPQTSHYASVRAKLEGIFSNTEPSDASSRQEPGSEAPGILSSKTKFQELADVMYFWALAEAYLQHPQMQQDMRQAAHVSKGLCPIIEAPIDRRHLVNKIRYQGRLKSETWAAGSPF